MAQEALDTLPCGFVVISEDGTILQANRTFRSLLGCEKAALAGTKFNSFLSRGSSIFFDTQFVPSLLLRGVVEEIALDLAHADDASLPIFVNATVRPGNGDGHVHLHLIIFVAKQRRRYESELLRTRREFEEVADIVRRSTDGIIRFSEDGEIVSWNPGAEQIFGWSLEKCKGHPFSSLFPPFALDEINAALADLAGGSEVSLETLALHQSGHEVDVSVRLTPHIEAPGRLVGFSAIVRDMTANKKAEKALLQSEKLASVGRLASSIAHEINNPLEAVTNLLYILQSRVHDEETTQLVITAQEELARVSHIATHTLRFHKQSSSRTNVYLQALAESVLALYRERLESSSIKAFLECQGNAHLSCYEGELRQVMVNLVANAYDAMRTGGKLIIRAHGSRNWRTGADGVRVLVADNGSGMNPETLARIFEPFFSTKGIGGTGLGLWITKDLVAKNAGTITARSTARAGRTGTVMNLFFEDSSQ